MAKKSAPTPSPLTFDLPLPLMEKIELQRQKLGLKSTSQVVRHAIEQFNFELFEAQASEHRQISVRLPDQTKKILVKAAKKKKVSVGELLRVAIDSLPAKSAPVVAAAKKKTKK
jgi:Arc/MetJ-type ribon-helix-helix transcriptional regulator